MRVRVSDSRTVPTLVSHLKRQGFPVTGRDGCELEVLFPAQPALFEAAAELDLWRAANGGATVMLLPHHHARGGSRPSAPAGLTIADEPE